MRRHVIAFALTLGAAGIASASVEPPAAEPCPLADSVVRSLAATNDATHALGRKDLSLALRKFIEAVELEPTNHRALYEIGLLAHGSKQYSAALGAFSRAAALSSKTPLYRMWHGVALYKVADAADADLEPAAAELEAAIALEPRLYRAHYYLGRIRRQQGDAARAVTAFAAAIEHGPREVEPYIALGELHRRWDYTAEAIEIFRHGTLTAQGDATKMAGLSFALGMACDDVADHACAIDALSTALYLDPSLHRARHARGLAYFKRKDDANAKADLEKYLADTAADPDDLGTSVATWTLRKIAERSRK